MWTEDNQEHQATAADYCVFSNVRFTVHIYNELKHTGPDCPRLPKVPKILKNSSNVDEYVYVATYLAQ